MRPIPSPFRQGALPVALLCLALSCGALAQNQNQSPNPRPNQPEGPSNPNDHKAPMQAQELTILVPDDAYTARVGDFSQRDAGNGYQFDSQGVNCTLYPARCQGKR